MGSCESGLIVGTMPHWAFLPQLSPVAKNGAFLHAVTKKEPRQLARARPPLVGGRPITSIRLRFVCVVKGGAPLASSLPTLPRQSWTIRRIAQSGSLLLSVSHLHRREVIVTVDCFLAEMLTSAEQEDGEHRRDHRADDSAENGGRSDASLVVTHGNPLIQPPTQTKEGETPMAQAACG